MDFSIRRNREYVVLFSIFLLALALRLVTARYDLLLEADPWYHFKISSILLESGEYPMYEYYTRYPFGEPVASPPGLYYTPVYIYKLIGFMGISFFKVFQLLPAIFGSLSVLPLYLLGRELYIKKIGLITALLFAISPAGIGRSLAGFYRGEVFMLFTMLFAFYFFIRSIKDNKFLSIPAAVFVFLSGLFWHGWPLVLVILTVVFTLGIFLNYFKNRHSNDIIISYAITSGIGMLFLFIFRTGFYRYEDRLKETGIFITAFKILFLITASMILFEILNRYLKNRSFKPVIPIASLLVVLALAYNAGYVQTLSEQYYKFLNTTKGVALTTVPTYIWRLGISEQQAVDLDYLIYIYNILIILSPVGLLFALKEKLSFKKVFSLTYVAISSFLLIFQVRFTFLAAPALCLFGAFPLYWLLMRGDWKKYLSLFLAFLLVFTNAYAATNFSSSIEPLIGDDLNEALIWIKQKTPEDSIILSWWDYTGPIMAIADRRTVTHTAPSGIVESTALALRTSNETQALEIFKSMKESFMLQDMKVDYLLIDNRVYSLWPKILMFEPYANQPIIIENRDLSNSLLNKLYTKRGSENFELVFENKGVKIYKPAFNYTRIIEIETIRYYSKGDEVKISVKTKSNEFEDAILLINVSDSKNKPLFVKEERIAGTSHSEITFELSDNMATGNYTIFIDLYSPQMENKHSMERVFMVVN